MAKAPRAKAAKALSDSGMYGAISGKPSGGGGMVTGGGKPRGGLPKTAISPNVKGHAGQSQVGKVVSASLPRSRKGK